MADEITTMPFAGDLVTVTPEEFTGDAYKFTTSDANHLTEDCFEWELRFVDIQTDSAPTYTVPIGTFDTTTADSFLGDLVETDHARPPLGSFVFGPAFDGTCFTLKDNLLYYCKPKQPEYWPALYYIEVSPPQFPLMTGVFYNGLTYVFSKSEIYFIQGTGNGTFFPLPMKARTGAQSIRGAVSVAGKGIYHTGPDGVYLFSQGNDVNITDDAFAPIFRGESVNDLPGVSDMSSAMLWTYRNYLYFAYTSEGHSYPTNLLVINIDTNRVSYYNYNDGSEIEVRAVCIDQTNQRLLIGDSTGFIRVIENTSYTDDSGVAISFEVQSKDYELQTRRHFPRWLKYDIDVGTGASCTGTLLLDGEVHHSHVITGSRNTRRRLVEEGNGNKTAIRFSGSGPVTIYAAELE